MFPALVKRTDRRCMPKFSATFVIGVSALALAACQPALIYGERTAFSLAAVQLNQEISEPVKIKSGYWRSVGLAAPPLGGGAQGGEAVSMFSSFDLDFVGNRPETGLVLPLLDGNDLNIRTRFASGQAAKEIAGAAPQVGAAIMGVAGLTFTPPGAADRADQDKLVSCANELRERGDRAGLLRLAADLGIQVSRYDPNTSMGRISRDLRFQINSTPNVRERFGSQPSVEQCLEVP